MGADRGAAAPPPDSRVLPQAGKREGQTIGGSGAIVRWANFVKLPHTLFALPFALVGATLASYRAPITLEILLWVTVAFTAARFTAMGFNRIVDRRIDARNPRTAMRELPTGAMGLVEAWTLVLAAALLFLVAAWRLNPLCLALAPAALVWVCAYSYTKRFTPWSHLVLGLGLGIAPVGGYLAVTGSWSNPWWMLPVLAAAVMCWTAGFDVLYALQDISFDRASGLYSLPAALGAEPAMRVARGLHVLTVVLLAAVGFATSAGVLFAIGATVAALLLAYEHSLVKPDDLTHVSRAFFTVNMALSAVFFAFVLAERLLR